MAVIVIATSMIIYGSWSFATSNDDTHLQTEPALYWHEVDANNKLGPVLNSSPQTKSQSMPTGSNPLTECTDNSEDSCLQGFTSPQTPGSDAEDQVDIPIERRINRSN